MESGIQRREINRLYSKKPICHSKGSNFGSAAILDCYAAFLLFGIGIFISFLILSFEILIKRKIDRIVSKCETIPFRPTADNMEKNYSNEIS